MHKWQTSRNGQSNINFGLSFATSLMIHGLVITLAATLVRHGNLRRPDFLAVSLVEIPAQEKIETVAQVNKPIAITAAKPRERNAPAKNQLLNFERPAPPAPKEETIKAPEVKPNVPPTPGVPANLSRTQVEGGGSEAGAGNLFARGDIGVTPGSGTAGGSGSASSGLGHGSGVAGLPMQTAPLKTNREAKPIQTARAAYPPMALRMGAEADVTLKIIVNSDGIVTKAEIIKSAGGGFDEEALKAIKLSRFEPAQKDGQNVPAEFTFIYKFRLQR